MDKSSDIALVTGASSGLGRDYCLQLAERCKKVILVARREAPMQELAAEIRESGCEAEVVVADLCDTLGVTRVIETIRQKGPVTYLVNNAGFTTKGNFADRQVETQQAMVDLHISATMSLSRAVIPFMKEAGRGWIINVASIAAQMPYPGLTVYAASKLFLVAFSEGLQAELANSNIKLQCFCPGYTHTGFHSTEEFKDFDKSTVPEDFWADSADCVRASINALAGDATTVIHGEQNMALYRDAAERLLGLAKVSG